MTRKWVIPKKKMQLKILCTALETVELVSSTNEVECWFKQEDTHGSSIHHLFIEGL